MSNTIGSLWVKLKGDTSHFDNGMSQATGKATGFGGVMKSVGATVAGFMIYDVGAKLVSGFANATKAGISYNATLETSRIKWETLLGTQEKANKMLKDIEKFAATTPFEKMGVEAMATQLHNAGFEGQALFDQISKFGDMAGAFGVQQASLEEMVRQYSQVQQAGIAYTEDLNILQDRGIPIYKALAKELGINTADVKKWASDGKISAEVYQNALDGIAKGVEGGMAKQSQSFNGMLSTLKDNMSAMAGTLAQPIFDFLKVQLENVMPLIEAISKSLSENGLMGTIQRFAPQAMPFIQAIIGIFDQLKASVKVIIDAIMGFWEEHKAWLLPTIMFIWNFVASFISNTINSIGLVVKSGLGIIDGIINFFQNLFSGNFKGCWESIKQIFVDGITFAWNWMQVTFAVNITGVVKNLAQNIPQAIKFMWESVKTFFSNGVTGCLQFVMNLFANASNSFNMLKTFGANTFQALWSVAQTMMSNLLKSVTQYIAQVPTTISNFMTQAVGVLKNINLFSIGADMIKGLINGIKSMASNVVGAIGNVVSGAIDAAKGALGIKSPSRVFMKFGEYTGEGLAIGIDKKNKDVAKASQRLSNSVIGGYNANISTGKNGLNGGTNTASNTTNNIIINASQPLSPYEVANETLKAQKMLAFGF
ncbi:MAG: tape measure protein [Paraclostridium sp.]